MKRSIATALMLGSLPIALWAVLVSAQQGQFGRFVGTVTAKWVDPSRVMELVDDFAYIDPTGTKWNAPKGSHVDGASIPQALWTLVGSPFTGEYRNASVVHDVACVIRDRPWQDVHIMFYNAMRCGGVSETRALYMYAAVHHFGPRWAEPSGFWDRFWAIFRGPAPPKEGLPPSSPPPPTAEDLKRLETMMQQQNVTTIDQVQRLRVR
jgi:hypothetical protein